MEPPFSYVAALAWLSSRIELRDDAGCAKYHQGNCQPEGATARSREEDHASSNTRHELHGEIPI